MATEGKVAFRSVDEKYGSQQNRYLQKANDSREQAGGDERAAENVGEDDIMRQHRAGKPGCNSLGRVLQFIHIGDELKSFIREEDTQCNAENIQKARAMTIAPRFYVGN